MEIQIIIGYALALLIGLSLGLIGGGGSILTVPVLVYVLHVNPVLATAYSLFIVGITSLVGGINNAWQKNVSFSTFLLFGIPAIISVYLTRLLIMPVIPTELLTIGNLVITKEIGLMLLFAVLMVLASVSMIRPSKHEPCDDCYKKDRKYVLIVLEGLGVGLITGLVGAGGGFLIIPALVILGRLPMKLAVGTSLFIIAAKSLIGFGGDIQAGTQMDWTFLAIFTAIAVAGIFAGGYLSKFVSGEKLKTAFGWFVLVMGIYIIFHEIMGG
jgi:uncharacterized protein